MRLPIYVLLSLSCIFYLTGNPWGEKGSDSQSPAAQSTGAQLKYAKKTGAKPRQANVVNQPARIIPKDQAVAANKQRAEPEPLAETEIREGNWQTSALSPAPRISPTPSPLIEDKDDGSSASADGEPAENSSKLDEPDLKAPAAKLDRPRSKRVNKARRGRKVSSARRKARQARPKSRKRIPRKARIVRKRKPKRSARLKRKNKASKKIVRKAKKKKIKKVASKATGKKSRFVTIGDGIFNN